MNTCGDARHDSSVVNSGNAAANKRPNILFFFTDDQRFDTIAALGNEHIITPNLDSLVRDGVTFTSAYIMGGSCPAVCMPSRAMLMSGRTLFHLEGRGEHIPDEHVLLPEAMQKAGYATFGTGKWHNGTRAYARAFSAGAEIFFGGMDDHWQVPACDFDSTGKYPKEKEHRARLKLGAEETIVKCRFDHVLKGKHSSELFSDAAIRFLRDYTEDTPFFMYVSYMAPHDPRTMPQEYLDMYDPESIPLPPNFLPEHPFDNGELWIRDEKLAAWPRTPKEIRKHITDYYAMITHLDAQIGRVLAALLDTGRADNTIIVFAGDNGLAVGRHGLMGKQNMYEHSVHVPLIMSGPGIPKGEKRDAYSYLLDIYPTLCDLTGVSIPDSVEGKSLVPAMRDSRQRIRDSLLFAYRDMQRSVRVGRYKLIEYAVSGKRTTQLFDLQADPWEVNNLGRDAACAGHVERLRRQLQRWKDEWDDPGENFWRVFGKV